MSQSANTQPGVVDRQEVPRFLRIAFYLMLLVAAALSVPRIGDYGPLPATVLMDVWIIAFIIMSVLRGRTDKYILLGLLLLYAFTRVAPALVTESAMYDFLQAYRWVLYLIAFTLAVRRNWGPITPLVRVTWALLIMAFVKSAATFLTIGPGERPGLLTENNFELALFAGLVAALYRHLGNGKFWMVSLLGAITVLSGSRSGAVAFLVLAIFAITQIPYTRATLVQRFLLLCLAPALVALPVWIFTSRATTAGIDRLNFVDVFLYEVRDWDLLKWLFGTTPITPLTDGCRSLSYYSSLFSSTGDDSCYSVVLHAFLLRVVFDAGIIGALIAFGVIWYTMRASGASRMLAGCVLLIALANSASVSGPNNPYVALPVLIVILTATSPGLRAEPGKHVTNGQHRYTRRHDP